MALQAVLRAERHVDHILCLADLVDYGPQPVECVKWAMKEAGNAWLLQGNHDRAVATGEDPRCSLPYRHLARVTQEFSTGRSSTNANISGRVAASIFISNWKRKLCGVSRGTKRSALSLLTGEPCSPIVGRAEYRRKAGLSFLRDILIGRWIVNSITHAW